MRNTTERVTEGWAAALAALTDEEVQALATAVRVRCSGYSGDVESTAVLRAASLLAGDATRNVGRAANKAVQVARAEVSAALARELPTDHETARELADDGRLVLWSRITSPAADARYRVTLRDLARALTLCLMGTGHGELWRDACRAYLRHSRDECDQCRTTGRAPTLQGILAHTRGLTKDRAEYWTLRRMTEAALREAAPRVLALVREFGGPGSRNVWTEDALALADAQRVAGSAYQLEAETALVTFRTEVTTETTTEAVHVPAHEVTWLARGEVPEARREAARVRQQAARKAREAAHAEAVTVALLARLATLPSVTESDREREAAQAREGLCEPLDSLARMPEPEGEYLHRKAVPARTVQVTRTRSTVTVCEPVPVPSEDALEGEVTITRTMPDGTRETYSRPLTEAEAEALNTRRESDPWADEHGRANTARVNIPDPYTGAVPSGKVPTSPRKRSRGNTGPTVPVRLTR